MIIKIITVYVPEKYINAIKLLVGEDKLYSSRSELIRAALRDFFLEKIEITQAIKREKFEAIKKTLNALNNENEEYVLIPTEKNEFKKHKIIREA